jgi:pSer/pThr/pTyr-binding forkhead associated (FHA) protein
MAQLRVYTGKKLRDVVDIDIPGLIVGRSSESDLVLPSEIISRTHCQVVEAGEGHVVLDLNSKSGVFVNGRRAYRHALQYGDRIELGKFTLVYHPSRVLGTIDPEDSYELTEHEVSEAFDDLAETIDEEVSTPGFRMDDRASQDPEEPQRFGGLMEMPRPASSLQGIEPPDALEDFKGTMMASTSQIIRVRDSLVAAQQPHLKVRVDGKFQHMPLGDRPFTVGYFAGAAFRLPGNKWLGKLQFSIESKGEDFYLSVLSFWAKVRIDGRRVRNRVPLKDEMVIEAGGTRFRFSLGDGI